MIDEDLKDWLIESYRDGTFDKEQAEYIVDSHNLPLSLKWKIDDFCKNLFDDFVKDYDYEKIAIVEFACRNFLKDLERIERVAKEEKEKKINEQYYNLI